MRERISRATKGQSEMTITTFGIVALIGATLGFRFSVLILVPAIGFAALAVAGTGIARGDQSNETIVAMILIATVLQVGYLLGAIARAIVIFSMTPEKADLASPRNATARSVPHIFHRSALR
jgi:hypothetical protein